MNRSAIAWSRVLQPVAVWFPAVGVIAVASVLRDSLPDTMVTQWRGGTPSTSMPTWPAFGVMAALAAAAAACAGRRERRRVWIATGFAALVSAVWLVLALINAQPEPEIAGWGLLTPLAFLYGGIPALLTWPAVSREGADRGAAPIRMPAEEARDIVVSPVICVLALATGLPALIAAWAAADAGALNGLEVGLGAATLIAVEFAVVRVERSPRRLVVYGMLPGLPLYKIRADRIRSVEVRQIRPLDWGGWGYRIGRIGTGVILRSGPGVTIHSISGGAFTVSVRHPERFVPSAARATPHPMNASSAA